MARIIILLMVTATTIQCVHLLSKKDAEIEQVKNNSRMEDFYSHACKKDAKCIRCAARRLLDKAAKANSFDPVSVKLAEAFKDVDDISAITVKKVWFGNSGRKKFWIAECRTSEKSLLLYFIKNRGRLILDEVD